MMVEKIKGGGKGVLMAKRRVKRRKMARQLIMRMAKRTPKRMKMK